MVPDAANVCSVQSQPCFLYSIFRLCAGAKPSEGDGSRISAVASNCPRQNLFSLHRSHSQSAARHACDERNPVDVTNRRYPRGDASADGAEQGNGKERPFGGHHQAGPSPASQINGCSVCVDMHAQEPMKAGETDRRIFAVAAWRDTPFFTEAGRAALERALQFEGREARDEFRLSAGPRFGEQAFNMGSHRLYTYSPNCSDVFRR